MTRFFAALLLATASMQGAIAAKEILRNDFRLESDPGIQLFVREVSTTSNGEVRSWPILLLHGARVGGVASFDLPVPGGSLAADLAQQGFDVFVMDVRGYGGSTKPAEMDAAPDTHAPLVRSNQAVRDISAVVDAIRQRKHVSRVALFGWATGGQWVGYYASLFPEKVSAMIVLNSLYRGNSGHPLIGEGSDLEDPAHAKHFNEKSCGAYLLSDANSLLRPWNGSISEQDKTVWRDPAVADAYVAAALASDPTSSSRTPPSFRSPCGALEDSFYLATGRQLWDASLVTAPTLILASEHDFWSRPEDRQNLANDLVHCTKVRVVVIPGATHFVHLDRPNHGRELLIKEIASFVPTQTSK